MGLWSYEEGNVLLLYRRLSQTPNRKNRRLAQASLQLFTSRRAGIWSSNRDSSCFGHGAAHHLPGECFETRLAAQRIKPPVDLDAAEDAGVEGRTIFVALFQQPQRFLFIAQRQVDDSQRIGRDITLAGYSR